MGFFDKLKKNKTVTPESRREKNNKFIKQKGIACLDNLPAIEASADVKLKDLDAICKRAIACLFSIQLALDIDSKKNYDESQAMFYNLLKKFKVEKDLSSIEKKLFYTKKYTNRDITNIVWTYEAYWAIVWALGLIDDCEMKFPNEICNCKKAMSLVSDCETFEEFKDKTKIRNIEEILDMLDLYYRYHWACVEKRVRPETEIGNLNPDVVWERRRGLEWLISNQSDWNYISLDT
ncbi:MAG: DUF4272 domain-containing protein [Eubacterium sp.]|nr:DUF4272 domain-containing protein [Eubacterium sp.]